MSLPPDRRCPNTSACRMFPLFSLAGVLEVWKTNYCHAAYERCARYQATLEGREVQDNLLPNNTLLRPRKSTLL